MDSPTLRSFNYEQFWLEQTKDFSFSASEPSISRLSIPVQDLDYFDYTRQGSEIFIDDSWIFKTNNQQGTPMADLLEEQGLIKITGDESFNDGLIDDSTKTKALAMPRKNGYEDKIEKLLKDKPEAKTSQKSNISQIFKIHRGETVQKIQEPQLESKPVKSSVSDKIDDSTHDKIKPKNQRRQDYQATKNLTKNYGTAILNFVRSPLSESYLIDVLKRENLDSGVFKNYIASTNKRKTRSIESFRSLILVDESDPNGLAASKRVLQTMAVIFIKYFSVNWIVHSKLDNKMTYLKWRGRMLRRVQEPKLFTYIRTHKKNKQHSTRKVKEAKTY